MAAGFTENNTFHEVMGQSGKEMHLFFSDGFCSFIPEEYKDIPLCRWKDSFRMPWGIPFPMDDFLNAASRIGKELSFETMYEDSKPDAVIIFQFCEE
jgi:hypothetical protein